MGLNVPIITFTPATLIRSAQVNANFSNLAAAPSFTGGVPTMNFDSGKLQSDGSGNIQLNNGIGMKANRDMIDWSSITDTYVKATKASGSLTFQVGSPGSGSTVVSALFIDSAGIHIVNNSLFGFDAGLVFQTGSISRSSTFTGNASGVYNHGNNGTPSVVLPTSNAGGNLAAIGFSSATASQVYISEEFGDSFKAWVVAF